MGVDDRLMPLPPLAEFVSELSGASIEGGLEDGGLDIAVMRLDLPVELEVERGTGDQPTIRATPPTQWTRTTVMPVLHRIRLTIEPLLEE